MQPFPNDLACCGKNKEGVSKVLSDTLIVMSGRACLYNNYGPVKVRTRRDRAGDRAAENVDGALSAGQVDPNEAMDSSNTPTATIGTKRDVTKASYYNSRLLSVLRIRTATVIPTATPRIRPSAIAISATSAFLSAPLRLSIKLPPPLHLMALAPPAPLSHEISFHVVYHVWNEGTKASPLPVHDVVLFPVCSEITNIALVTRRTICRIESISTSPMLCHLGSGSLWKSTCQFLQDMEQVKYQL